MNFGLSVSASSLAAARRQLKLASISPHRHCSPSASLFGNAKGYSAYDSVFDDNEICGVAMSVSDVEHHEIGIVLM